MLSPYARSLWESRLLQAETAMRAAKRRAAGSHGLQRTQAERRARQWAAMRASILERLGGLSPPVTDCAGGGA